MDSKHRVEYIAVSDSQWADTKIVPGGESFRTLSEFRCSSRFSVDKNGSAFPVLMGTFGRTLKNQESRFIPIGFRSDSDWCEVCMQMGGWFGPQPVVGRVPYGDAVDFSMSVSCERVKTRPDLVRLVRYGGLVRTGSGKESRLDCTYEEKPECPLFKGGCGLNISAGTELALTVGGCRFYDDVVRDNFSGKIYSLSFLLGRMDGHCECYIFMPYRIGDEGCLVDVRTGMDIRFSGDKPVGVGPDV